jgi:hypothetical protein
VWVENVDSWAGTGKLVDVGAAWVNDINQSGYCIGPMLKIGLYSIEY